MDGPLHASCRNGDIEMASIFLDCDYKNDDGWLPIHVASRWGYHKIVKMLCNDISYNTRTTEEGWSAMDIAKKWNHKKVIDVLLDYKEYKKNRRKRPIQ